MPMSDFLVKRNDLRECRIVESSVPELEPGQTLLRVDSFGLTANNVTYAVLGEMMSYWDFFPAENGWGRIPMWGFAEVEQSEAEDVEPGMRVYGYLPPSSYLAVTPAQAGADGFVDGSPAPSGAARDISALPGDRRRSFLPCGHRGSAAALASVVLHIVSDR